MFRDFPTFSCTCIFFLLTLSLLWSSLFYSSLLSDSSHLCFSSVHIVGSLTSKLSSIIIHNYIWLYIIMYNYIYNYIITYIHFPIIFPLYLILSPLYHHFCWLNPSLTLRLWRLCHFFAKPQPLSDSIRPSGAGCGELDVPGDWRLELAVACRIHVQCVYV